MAQMLTTSDNPYDPHKDYDKWMMWDQDNNYFTAEYLDRVAVIPDGATDDQIQKLIEQAQQEIVNADVLGVYILV